MNDQWYVFQEGGESAGPFVPSIIRSQIKSGFFNADTRVSRDGKSQWVTLSTVAEFSASFPGRVAEAAPLDPFAELQAPAPEEQLRAAIREALADGVVTAAKKAGLEALQKKLGIAADVVQRIVREENARRLSAECQPSPSAESKAVVSAPLSPPHQPVNVPSPPPRVRPAWVQPAVVAAIGFALLGGGYYFFMSAKPDKTEEEADAKPRTPMELCQQLKGVTAITSCEETNAQAADGGAQPVSFVKGKCDPALVSVDFFNFKTRADADAFMSDRNEVVKKMRESATATARSMGVEPKLWKTTEFRSKSGITVAVFRNGPDAQVADQMAKVEALVKAEP